MKNKETKEPQLIITVAGRAGSGKTLISLAIADYLLKHGLNVCVEDIDGESATADGTEWWKKIGSLRDKKTNILIKQTQIKREKLDVDFDMLDDDEVKVEIIESERGWGQKVDSVKEFKTKAAAEKFIKEFNKTNEEDYAKTHEVPEWYMYARLAE
jgi:CO dehydrogenase nickel-insertion accessory protein CooC1